MSRNLILLFFLIQATFAQSQDVFVDQAAAGSNDGTSWENAYTDLQDALSGVGPKDVWIAQGIYTPAAPGGSRVATFRIENGYRLYGGFSGTETQLDQRDIEAYPTILSGDLNGDDHDQGNRTDNSLHVTSFLFTDSTPLLDGLIIRSGNASASTGSASQGGGIRIVSSSPSFVDCIIEDHFGHLGAGVVVNSSTVSFDHCVFRNNEIKNGRGGGIFVSNGSSLTVTTCVFDSNDLSGGAGVNDGGAIFIETGGSAVIDASIFKNNSALSTSRSIAATGGAITSLGTSLEITNCIFRNQSANVGGALWVGPNTLIANCLFMRNEAVVGLGAIDVGGFGGAINNRANTTAPLILTNSVLYSNTANDGGGLVGGLNALVEISNSILWGNSDSDGMIRSSQVKGPGDWAASYSCIQNLLTTIPGEDPPNPASFPGCIDDNPLFFDPDGADNVLGNADDDFRVTLASPAIDAGRNSDIPSGITDDLVGNPRRLDEASVPNSGSGSSPLVDMGVYEFSGNEVASISIDGGAGQTLSTTVQLTLSTSVSGSGRQMRFSNNEIHWSSWEAFNTSKTWMIPNRGETHRVYLQIRNNSNAILATANDAIELITDPCFGETVEPNITCPAPPPLGFVSDGCTAIVPDLTQNTTISDNCDELAEIQIIQTPTPGSLVGLGTHVITLTAEDTSGNSSNCEVNWTVVDRAFIRGNVQERQAHILNITDVVVLLEILFENRAIGFDCEAASDVNNDGEQNVLDVVGLALGIFRSELYSIPEPMVTPGVVIGSGGSIASILNCNEGEYCP